MIKKIDKTKLKALAGNTLAKAYKQHQNSFVRSGENIALLRLCSQDWDSMYDIRREHERNVRYRSGDQWSDMVEDPDKPGTMIREDALISRSGRVPLKHNFIQQFIRNIHSPLLTSPQQTVVYARTRDDQQLGNMLTNTIQACHQLNKVKKLDINVIEELCLTGMACAKIRFDFWSTKNRTDGRIDLININRLFFNQDIEDPRLLDIRRIGEIHDYTFDDLVRNFATTKADEKVLSDVYASCRDSRSLELGYANYNEKLYSLSFLVSNDMSKFRVIEAWEKLGRWVTYVHDYADGTEDVFTDITIPEINAINAERLEMGQSIGLAPEDIKLIYAEPKYEYYWRVKFLTPNGFCLKEQETPYAHEDHPYAIAMMPLIDGKFKAMLSDVIDIQRYINRLLTLLDFIIGSSAKGLLMVPQDAIPDGMDISSFAKEYTKVNGVILMKKGTTAEHMPKQITNNSTNIGAWEMFAQEMNIMQQISGLSGAMQGQAARPGMPSSLYAQEAQNSLLNFTLLFETFNSFCEERDEKLLKVLMQYIDTPRYVDINGKEYNETAKMYEPEMAKKIVDFNLTATKSIDTPVFRQMTDDLLMKLLDAGQIPLEVFLQNSSLPFSEKLLNDMKTLKEGMASGGQMDPEAMQRVQGEIAQNVDPRAMEMLNRVAT